MNDKPPRIDWRGADLRGINLQGVNLEGADLRASDLRGVNLSQTNLRYADLRGAQIQQANFQRANLYGAKMQGVEAQMTDFRGADLRQANMGGAYMDGAMMPAMTVEPDSYQKLLDERVGTGDPKSKEKTKEKEKQRCAPTQRRATSTNALTASNPCWRRWSSGRQFGIGTPLRSSPGWWARLNLPAASIAGSAGFTHRNGSLAVGLMPSGW